MPERWFSSWLAGGGCTLAEIGVANPSRMRAVRDWAARLVPRKNPWA